MKIAYLVNIEDAAQGMFDEDHDLITAWSPNNAVWDVSAFEDFMDWAGVVVDESLLHEDPILYAELQAKLAAEMGLEDGWQEWG